MLAHSRLSFVFIHETSRTTALEPFMPVLRRRRRLHFTLQRSDGLRLPLRHSLCQALPQSTRNVFNIECRVADYPFARAIEIWVDVDTECSFLHH